MLGKGELVLACLFCLGNGRRSHSQQIPASSHLEKKKEQQLAGFLFTLGRGDPSFRKSALVHDRVPKLTRRRSRGINLVLTQPNEDVIAKANRSRGINLYVNQPSEDTIPKANWLEDLRQKTSPGNWLEDLRQKMSGRAAFASLVAETIVFWIAFLLPAAAFLYHQSSGLWMPETGDAEGWASFTSILSGCYVFCKIPPIEAARWAWVFAWTPWFQEKFFSDDDEVESKVPPDKIGDKEHIHVMAVDSKTATEIKM